MNRNSWQSYLSSLGLISWLESRFTVSTFCILHFFFKVHKNPLEKVYCYSSLTKLLISITAWIPVQGGFGEVLPSATAVMKALIDVSNLIFLCMNGCQKRNLIETLYTLQISFTNWKESSRGLGFFWGGRGKDKKLLCNLQWKKVQILKKTKLL